MQKNTVKKGQKTSGNVYLLLFLRPTDVAIYLQNCPCEARVLQKMFSSEIGI